jgi:hypothetical protein
MARMERRRNHGLVRGDAVLVPLCRIVCVMMNLRVLRAKLAQVGSGSSVMG